MWGPLSFLLCLSRLHFFLVSAFLYSLSLSPSARHLCLQTHGWQSMTIQITNPWLICDWPQINHQPSPRWPKESKPWRPTTSNGPMATYAIWTNPQPHTRSKATHGNPQWSKPTHNDLNPTHGEPRPPPAHSNLNPTPIWSLQADLERKEKLSLWEEERREHGRKRGEEKKEESGRKRECD